MSLEQALAANTAAVELLTKVLAGASVTIPSPQGAVTPASGDKEGGKKTKPKADPKTDAPKTEPATTPAVTGPSLKLVTDTVLEFAATESVAAKAILKSFGVSRITELKAEVYTKVLDAVAAAKVKIAEELATGNDDDPNSLV